jgi:hypothetical protein
MSFAEFFERFFGREHPIDASLFGIAPLISRRRSLA